MSDSTFPDLPPDPPATAAGGDGSMPEPGRMPLDPPPPLDASADEDIEAQAGSEDEAALLASPEGPDDSAEPDGDVQPARGDGPPRVVPHPTPERDALDAEPSTQCLNCGQALPGAYCPACGQKAQRLRQPVHRFVASAFTEFFGFEGRVWASLGILLFRPGRLTTAYLAGRRAEYLRPLRLYITSTLLFFVLLAAIDPAGRIEGSGAFRSDEADSSRVDVHLAENDSLLAARPIEWAADAAKRDSFRARADALQTALDGLQASPDTQLMGDSLEERLREIEDLVEDATPERWETAAARQRDFAKMQIESAILSTFPQDSVIAPEDLHEALNLIYGNDNGGEISVGPDWLARSSSARLLEQARTDRERLQAGLQFARDVISQVPTVMFFLLPLFALLLKGLYLRRDRYFSEHVIFALHTHAFAFVVFSVIAVVLWLSDGAGWAGTTAGILGGSIPIYFLIAQKHVYGQGWIRTLVKAWLLAWMYGFVLIFGLVGALLLAAAIG